MINNIICNSRHTQKKEAQRFFFCMQLLRFKIKSRVFEFFLVFTNAFSEKFVFGALFHVALAHKDVCIRNSVGKNVTHAKART